MKNLLLLISCIFALKTLDAQVPTAMSPEANNFYTIAMPAIKPQVKSIVIQTAGAIKHYKVNADSLLQRLQANKALKNLGNNDIEGILVLIMVQASKDADADLKLKVLAMGHRNDQKQDQQTTVQPASVNNADNKNKSAEEIDDMENLQLHRIMDRKSRMAEEINNVMKNISGNQQNIVNNLR